MNRHRIPVPLSLLLVATLLLLSAGPFVSSARAETDYFSANPTPLVFPDQTVRVTSEARTINVKNETAGMMTIGTISVVGPFAMVPASSSCVDMQVPTGGTCTVAITFTPQDAGTHSGSLTIRNTPYDLHLITVPLSGVGTSATPPNVTADKPSLNFGEQALSTRGGPLEVTFTNTGGTAASLGAADARGIGSTSTGEFYVGSTTCVGSLEPTTSCIVGVYFAPVGALGGRTGVLILRDSNGATLISIPLSGNGVTTTTPPPTIAAAFTPQAARAGDEVTLTVTTSADTKCIVVSGAHNTTLTDSAGKASWTVTFNAETGDGTRSVTVIAYANDGCTGSSATAAPAPSYLLDNTPPVTAHDAPSGWRTDASVTVTLTPTDNNGSGVATTAYILDGGAPQSGTSVTVSGDRDHTLEFWSTDRVGNVEAHQTTHIKLDQAGPTITATVAPPPNPSGWNNGTVTVTFACADALSPVTCPDPIAVTTEGRDQSFTGTATDSAGNTASASVIINIDKSAPTLVGTPINPPNAAGWYNGDVPIGWTCDDTLSGIPDGTCPRFGNVTGHGNAQTTTASVTDRAGNTGSGTSTPVRIDRVAPTTATDAPSGWSTADRVTVTLTAGDDLSGVAVTYYKLDNGAVQNGTSVTIEAEGYHTITYWSADNADNVEVPQVVQVRIDRTRPTITHSQSPAANTNGWNNTDVTVTFACIDAAGPNGSGIDTCTPSQTVTTEGANQTVSGTAVDQAGHSNTATASVSIDKTAPTVTGAPTIVPNAAGWYNGDVPVSWSCADTLSGVADDACPTSGTITGEGSAQTTRATVSDRAGNSTVAVNAAVRIDRSPPTTAATPDRPAPPGGVYTGLVTITLTATDALSGVARTSYTIDGGGPQAYAAPFTLSGDGTHTVRFWSTDAADNAEAPQALTIVIGSNVIIFAQPDSRQTYGAAAVALTANASSSLPITFSTTGPCHIVAATAAVALDGAGDCAVTASQAGDATHPAATPVTHTITIIPATLTVRVVDQSRPYSSDAALACTFAYTGLVNNDTEAAVVTGQPFCSTTATAASPAGSYTLVTNLGTLAVRGGNYTPALASGTLTITPATTVIAVGNTTATAGAVNVTLTATARRSVGDNGTLPDGSTLTFTVRGQGYTAATIGGSASVAVSLVGAAAGTYPIAVNFAGDANHTTSQGSGTLTVTTAPPPTPTPSPAPSAGPILTVVPTAPDRGSVTVTRDGNRATLTVTPAAGQLFLGWKVNDGAVATWVNPLTLSLTADTRVEATFTARPSFTDAGPGQTGASEAIAQLAARGIIRGCDPDTGLFCPADPTLRVHVAAMIVRAIGWGGETHRNPFADRAGVDDELWNTVAILAAHGVAKGYGDGTFGTAEPVRNAQVISFITRAMVAKGYWQYQPDDARVYPNVGADSGHRIDLVTYAHYAGPVRGTNSTSEDFSGWDQPSSRAWFAFALWQALDSYFGR